jgi:CpXC motif protein
MSMFQSEKVSCPGCGQAVDFTVVYSVNADRRPDLREAIISSSFQRQSCPACGKVFRLEPEMNYIHVAGKQWILCQPFSKVLVWNALEDQARATFALAYGDKASRGAQAIGRDLQVRITFGWAALREKLLCAQHGLDDITLDLLKFALLRDLDDPPLADDTELRLYDLAQDEIALAWIQTPAEKFVETLQVPRAVYDDIAADQAGWQELRSELSAGPFVDLRRLLIQPVQTGNTQG